MYKVSEELLKEISHTINILSSLIDDNKKTVIKSVTKGLPIKRILVSGIPNNDYISTILVNNSLKRAKNLIKLIKDEYYIE